jgi:hypothetical protein
VVAALHQVPAAVLDLATGAAAAPAHFPKTAQKVAKKWCSLSVVRCVSGRIADAFAANTADRLQTLLLGVEITLRRTVTVHDGAPGRILRAGHAGERQKKCAANDCSYE